MAENRQKIKLIKIYELVRKETGEDWASSGLLIKLGEEKTGMTFVPEIDQKEGLITYTIRSGNVDASKVDEYLMYVNIVENRIYERLLDSKLLIVRNGDSKVLKFPYKHVIIFPDQKVGRVAASKDIIRKMLNYDLIDKQWFDKYKIKYNQENLIEELFGSAYTHLGYVDPLKTGG